MRVVFLSLLLVIPAAPAGAGIVSGTARVIDGDTLEIEGHRIRLYGIDAPSFGRHAIAMARSGPAGRNRGASSRR